MKYKKTIWKKITQKNTIEWVGKDEKSLKKIEEAFEKQVGKKTSFKKCIDKMKYTVNQTMRKKKSIRTSKINSNMILAAVWMDDEIRSNIKLSSPLQQTMEHSQEK